MSDFHAQPFTLPMFKDFVPRRVRFWTFLLFALIFQLSDGFYMASTANIAGSLAFKPSDITMCAYISFIGLTMLFPILFPIKFRFGERTNLIIAATGLICCNLLVNMVTFLPALAFICFMAGIFRIWGTFSCMSTIMQGITPTFNPGHFLSVMFLLVLGAIQISGFLSSYVTYFMLWRFMHYLAIGLELFVVICACCFMKSLPVKRDALKGVDWPGMVLWSVFLIAIVFVAVYGEQLGWLVSPLIRGALGIVFLSLAFNILRMSYVENPFIDVKSFKCRNLSGVLILFFVLCVMLCSQTVLQNTFTSAVLHFDSLNSSTLNLYALAGVVLGACFSYYTLVVQEWKHRNVMFVGILFVTLYAVCMYCLVSPQTNLASFFLPSLFRGFGTCLVYVSLTSYCEGAGEFRYFFQVLCLLGFIRTGVASPIGGALYQHSLQGLVESNMALLGSNVNPAIWAQMSYSEVCAEVSRQSLLVSLQQMFGVTVLIGMITMLLIMISRYRYQYRKLKFFQ